VKAIAKPRLVEKKLTETKRSQSRRSIAAIAWHDAVRGHLQRE
jgi:hypothetical protein